MTRRTTALALAKAAKGEETPDISFKEPSDSEIDADVDNSEKPVSTSSRKRVKQVEDSDFDEGEEEVGFLHFLYVGLVPH